MYSDFVIETLVNVNLYDGADDVVEFVFVVELVELPARVVVVLGGSVVATLAVELLLTVELPAALVELLGTAGGGGAFNTPNALV